MDHTEIKKPPIADTNDPNFLTKNIINMIYNNIELNIIIKAIFIDSFLTNSKRSKIPQLSLVFVVVIGGAFKSIPRIRLMNMIRLNSILIGKSMGIKKNSLSKG